MVWPFIHLQVMTGLTTTEVVDALVTLRIRLQKHTCWFQLSIKRCPESSSGALPLRAASITVLISSDIMARMVAKTWRCLCGT